MRDGLNKLKSLREHDLREDELRAAAWAQGAVDAQKIIDEWVAAGKAMPPPIAEPKATDIRFPWGDFPKE